MTVPPAAPTPRPTWMLIAACVAVYALFWLVGRPLLPARVQLDATAGLLPTLAVGSASVALLRRNPQGIYLAAGGLAALLTVYVVLMRLIF